MSIDEKIKSTDIKKILIVDDTLANIEAAKQYFNELDVKVDYASSAKEAKEKIKQSYEEKDSYSLILSDLTMEEKTSGLEVVKEGFKHLILSYIVTGANYQNPNNHGHGPSTQIEPKIGSVSGRKDQSEVWKELFEKVLDHISGEGKVLYKSIERYKEFVGAPSDSIADMCITLYRHIER